MGRVRMNSTLSRRDVLRTVAAAGCLVALPEPAPAGLRRLSRIERRSGWVSGEMTGAQALVETLQLEGAECVFGIPGAQSNELWDTMKSKRLAYLLATHEFSAACMAD